MIKQGKLCSKNSRNREPALTAEQKTGIAGLLIERGENKTARPIT